MKMLKVYIVCNWSVEKPLNGRKAVSPYQPWKHSLLFHTGRKSITRKRPQTQPTSQPTPIPPRSLRKVILEYHVISVDLNGSTELFPAHTLCGMLVFLDHIRKVTTRQHSALTMALQSVPNEPRARVRGGKLAGRRAEELTCSPCTGCQELPSLPHLLSPSPVRGGPAHLALIPEKDEDDGARRPKGWSQLLRVSWGAKEGASLPSYPSLRTTTVTPQSLLMGRP